jgi:hypothetical protein
MPFVAIGHNGCVDDGERVTPGRHAGPPRPDPAGSATAASRPTGTLLLLALGITVAIVAWGYLVYLAIDVGSTARNGDDTAWWLLALATVGAIACLFAGLMLGVRLVERLRVRATPPGPSHHPGGRRAAR